MPDFNPQDYAPGYGGKIDSQGNIKNIADVITPDGKVAVDIGEVDVTLNASDIQIGAVEIKDATGTNRLAVNSDGSINMRVIGSIDGGTF
jgi:hypothetical protein